MRSEDARARFPSSLTSRITIDPGRPGDGVDGSGSGSSGVNETAGKPARDGGPRPRTQGLRCDMVRLSRLHPLREDHGKRRSARVNTPAGRLFCEHQSAGANYNPGLCKFQIQFEFYTKVPIRLANPLQIWSTHAACGRAGNIRLQTPAFIEPGHTRTHEQSSCRILRLQCRFARRRRFAILRLVILQSGLEVCAA